MSTKELSTFSKGANKKRKTNFEINNISRKLRDCAHRIDDQNLLRDFNNRMFHLEQGLVGR